MNKNFFVGLFVGLGLLAIFAFRPAAEKPVAAVQKWEYLKYSGAMGGLSEDKMNSLGKEGWELVSFEVPLAFFKRRIE